jgi:hypothetical protein
MTTILRSLVRAGSTRLAKKLGKSIPLVGTAVVVGLVGYEIKQKGLMRGIVNTALDATPVLGTAKNVIEVFTGDWLADKKTAEQKVARAD